MKGAIYSSQEERTKLLIAGLSKQLGVKVVIKDKTINDTQQQIHFADYSAILHGIPVVEEELVEIEDKKIDSKKKNESKIGLKVNVKSLQGDYEAFDCGPGTTVRELKQSISKKWPKAPVKGQKLLFAGKELEDHHQLGEHIQKITTIHLIILKLPEKDKIDEGTSSSGDNDSEGSSSTVNTISKPKLRSSRHSEDVTILYLNADEMLAPKYDFKYPDADTTRFERGGKEYKRPVGCLRYALNVLGRYDTNSWLSDKSHGWPVCFHCNTEKFLPMDQVKIGDVYASPDYQLAFDSADSFEYEGEEYKLFYQDRVNPDKIKETIQTVRGTYWVVSSGTDIRPYGICIKKV